MNEYNKKLYTHKRFLFMTLDPVHIGTGGYRLGRVDSTIVREKGTNLPKIPGTSLSGSARSYAAMYYEKPQTAGQHKNFKGDKNTCPIIYTFGTAAETGGGQAGKISISDAQTLFFPVHSMAGPVWVSTRSAVEQAGFQLNNNGKADNDTALTSLTWDKDNLNLGWLLLKIKTGLNLTPPSDTSSKKEWEAISSRIVLVSPKLFSQIVNSNLEVRTSVAINPETGAAEDKALFTYEAIPRAAWLWSDIIEDDYLINDKQSRIFPVERKFKDGKDNSGDSLEETWSRPLDVVSTGLKLIEYLGVGGMGTRGFGRMGIVSGWEVKNNES